jgi:S-DNA-T family DNA segregation ATPase FtsK/SpoIIIE
MNRLMHVVTTAIQEFANATNAVEPLADTLNARAARQYQAQFGHHAEKLRMVHALSHGLGAPPADDRTFTSVHASTAEWSDSVWKSFAPQPANVAIPRLTRTGSFTRDVTIPGGSESQRVSVPAMAPILGCGGCVLVAEGKQLDAARFALQSILLRLIAALPAGSLRLTLVDQLGVGNNFALLTPFHEIIRGRMVWHDPKQIANELDALIEHMAMVTQKYLKTEFNNIEAYNESQGIVEEPYRILAIANFPAGFDKSTAEQVVSIAQNGPRSGVYVILSVDRKQPMPFGFRFEDLARFCTVLEGTITEGFLWYPNVHGWPAVAAAWSSDVLSRGRVTLDELPPTSIVEAMAAAMKDGAIERATVRIPFSRFVPRTLWSADTVRGISVPIGRAGNDDQLFELSVSDSSAHHAVVGGRTGSGKSILLKGLITSLCQRYSPDELELYLIDFKGGVELRIFAELPHARVIALESEREFGLSVLEGLLREKANREQVFKQKEVNNLRTYREHGGSMSRILLIVDEFQVFFESNDRIATRTRAALDDLARKGRSFGIHVVLASQSISASVGAELDQATLNQFGLRIALAMNESDSTRILSRDNDAAKFLTRAGEAIFNAQNGLPGGNVRFQAAYVTDDELTTHIRAVRALADERSITRKPFIFEGSRAATIADNAELLGVIAHPPETTPRAIPLFVGEPAALQEVHTSFRMRRQACDNLLLVGQQDSTMFPIFFTALWSWSLYQPHSTAKLIIFNLTNDDDPFHEHFELFQRLPQHVRIGRNRNVVPWLEELSSNLDQRRGDQETPATESPRERTLVAFYGLQRARDLIRDGGTNNAAAKKLARLIHDGPELGMSFIAAADMYANLIRVLDPKDLNDFGGRIAGIGADSGKIMGDNAMGFKVREHYGVLYEPEKPDTLQKFRTYGSEQLQWIQDRFARKESAPCPR